MKEARVCPFCKKAPSLKRVGDQSDSGWIYACENWTGCPVQPKLRIYFMREEDALRVWNGELYNVKKT